MFKATKEGMQDSGFNFLMMPYCGPAKVKSVALAEINNTPNCFVETFEVLGEDIKEQNVNGLEHQNVEWAPDSDEDKETTQKKIDRIAYFAGKIAGQDKVQAIEASSWVEYGNKIIALLESEGIYERDDINIKVVGNVYNGKARVQTPKYPAWLAVGGKPLTFSKSELRQNQEYLDAISASPSETTEDAVATSAIDEAGF